MKSQILFLLYGCMIAIFNFSLCSDIEKSDKQTKADACVKIIRSRMNQDENYYKELIDFLSIGTKKEEALNKLFSISLLTCYKQITFFDAEEIDNSNKINALTSENKQLLNWEKWENLFKSGDQEALNYEMSTLNEGLEDLRSGEINLNYLHEPQGQQDGRSSEYDERLDYISKNEKKIDFSIFGFNFTQLDGKSKNLLGISLIVLVFLFVIGGLQWINSIRNQNQKDKKKKKKEK